MVCPCKRLQCFANSQCLQVLAGVVVHDVRLTGMRLRVEAAGQIGQYLVGIHGAGLVRGCPEGSRQDEEDNKGSSRQSSGTILAIVGLI